MYLEVYNHFLKLSILAALENGSLWNMAVYQPVLEILLLQASFKMLFVLKKKKSTPENGQIVFYSSTTLLISIFSEHI